MHSFADLIDRSSSFTLASLKEAGDEVVEALQTSGATHLVKFLQMIQLQKAILPIKLTQVRRMFWFFRSRDRRLG